MYEGIHRAYLSVSFPRAMKLGAKSSNSLRAASKKSSPKLPECCRCNDKGSCSRCMCVKKNSHCVNCLPLKRGHCKNVRPDLTQVVDGHNVVVSPLGSPCHSPKVIDTDTSCSPPVSPPGLPPSSPCMVTPFVDHVVDAVPSLPVPAPVAEPTFRWGVIDGASFEKVISDTYEEVVHWRKHYFPVPCGQCGKAFVSELARLFKGYAESSSMESVSMKAVTVLCILLLQRPHSRAKPRECAVCLSR